MQFLWVAKGRRLVAGDERMKEKKSEIARLGCMFQDNMQMDYSKSLDTFSRNNSECSIISFQAIKNQKEIRRKTAASIKQKLPSIPVSIRKQQLTGRKEEKCLPKTLHSPSLSLGQCELSVSKVISLVKPEPLGFLLPTGIAQTVQELKYE